VEITLAVAAFISIPGCLEKIRLREKNTVAILSTSLICQVQLEIWSFP